MNEEKRLIKIISDSSCDLTKEEIKNFDIDIVPFFITFDEKEYLRENVDIKTGEFYDLLLKNEKLFPKSSTPNPNDYFIVFEKYAELGMDIICLCISSNFSSSYQSACIAKDMICDEYENIKIEIVDTRINTVSQGLFTEEICKANALGYSFEELISFCEELKETGKIIFTVGSLTYLAKGGRIGKLSSLIGQGLQLKPIITLEDGDIKTSGISFGRKRSIEKVVSNVKDFFIKKKLNPEEYAFAIGYGSNINEANSLYETVVKLFGDLGYTIKAKIGQIGSTIAVHTGPFAIGIGFIKKLILKKSN